MASVNLVILIGNLGSDPEMRFTPNGNPVTQFRIAVTEKYTKDGEQREKTNWFSIVTWNKLAEICNQYLTKGSPVYIEGTLENESWTGEDGQTKYRTKVNARKMQMLGKSKDSGTRDTSSSVIEVEDDDDAPF